MTRLPGRLRRIDAADAQVLLSQGLPADWVTSIVTSAGTDVGLLVSVRAAHLATLGRGLTERRMSPANASRALVPDLVPLLRCDGTFYISCTGAEPGRRPAALVPLRSARLLHPIEVTRTTTPKETNR